MNTRDMIQVMQAYEDGKQIEYKGKDEHESDDWSDNKDPLWNWVAMDYRIKPTKKPVDLSVLIDSGIDCEFSNDNNARGSAWRTGRLVEIEDDRRYPYLMDRGGDIYNKCCRPRMNHIHAWQGGECPLPEGFIVDVWYRDIDDETDSDTGRGLATQMQWAHEHYGNDIIAFEVIGLADGYCDPWEQED